MNLASDSDSVFIGKLTEITLANLGDEAFGVKQLVEKTGLSHFVIRHRVKSITKKTISQFIVEIRLQKALEILQKEEATSSEVAYGVGFGSPGYFNKCFHEFYGYPPGDVRKRKTEGTLDMASAMDDPKHRTEERKLRQSKKNTRLKILLFIMTGLMGVIILIWLVFTFSVRSDRIPGNAEKSDKKSIAVLPFINDSPDSTNIYFINGIMEGVLDRLSKIGVLTVLSRTSVEQYRNNKTKTLPQIAKELGVNYIVEGSGQKYGDRVMLSVQLIEANSDRQIFSRQYDRKWEDIFSIQSEIATSVAASIKVTITPEETELIEKKPTENMAALNLWLHGRELAIISRFGNNSELERKAEIFFRRAVLLDSTFAEAYVSLGWRQFVKRNYDSTLYFADRALHFDPEYAEGYGFKGFICNILGLDEEAENAFALALKLNPDNTAIISNMGDLQFDKGEYAKSLELYLKALQLANEPFAKSGILRSICSILYTNGLYEEGLQFAEKIIETNGDSLYYIMGLITSAISRNDYSSAYRKAMESFRWNPRDNYASWRSIGMYLTRDCNAALTFVDECIETIEKQGTRVQPRYYFGYVYLKNGQTEKSDYHFEGAIQNEMKILEREQPHSACRASVSLACIYSAMDDKVKSVEYLRKAIQYKEEYIAISPLLITEFKNNPMFDIIRREPEFQKLIRIAEEKWISERRKIEKLMQEEGISD
ncbi:MAG: helix-turn-helix domain-containing protein [Bacteroidales bacterium]|nr:helix-turn-helix domain-containing protein [Bacteroidales bacterium]MDT8402207.1 helix-turn-helix domain-containing protein [Bacteroidales bacterium]